MDIHTFISPLISIKLYIYIYHHWSQLLTVHHIDFQFSSQRVTSSFLWGILASRGANCQVLSRLATRQPQHQILDGKPWVYHEKWEFHMSDRQNLNWKMRSSGQSYRFWEFTISFYSISWLHHLHPLANCVRKAFLHLHFSVWSMFDCPALSFAALQLYGMVWYLSMQLQITVAPSFLKLRNKFEFSCWKKSGWALTATCSMPFIHSPASG